DHDDWHDPPCIDVGRHEQGREDQGGGDRGGNRPVAADNEVCPERDQDSAPRPDEAHRQALGLNPSTRRRSIVMYVPAVTRYNASRPRMAPSPAGHSMPRPSSDQKVPKVVSRMPTTSCRRLRGIRVTTRCKIS